MSKDTSTSPVIPAVTAVTESDPATDLLAAPPAAPCTWWCTVPGHREPGRWQHISAGSLSSYCRSESITIPGVFDSVIAGAPGDDFELHLERYQGWSDGEPHDVSGTQIHSATGWHPDEDWMTGTASAVIIALANVAALADLTPRPARHGKCPVWCTAIGDHGDDHAGEDVEVGATGNEDTDPQVKGAIGVCTVHSPTDSRPSVYLSAESYKRELGAQDWVKEGRRVSMNLTPGEARVLALNLLRAAALAEAGAS